MGRRGQSAGETYLLGVYQRTEEARDGECGLVEAEDDPVEPGEGGGRSAIAKAGHGVVWKEGKEGVCGWAGDKGRCM